MSKYVIKQLHTFEYYYEIEANSIDEALFKLQSEAHEPTLEEFHWEGKVAMEGWIRRF